MSNYDLEEELNRIKLEFDQKFGGTGMSFDELPDDLESMLNQPQYTVPSKNTPVYSQPVQHSRPQQQSRPTQPLQSPKVVDTEIPDYDDYETIEPRNFTLNQKAMVASYLDEEEELETEFDDALPPLEDMLLLIKNPEIHKAYNYTLPKRQIVQPQYQQPQYQPQQQQHQSQGGGIPPLDQPAWNVRDCESVVQHLKSLLMSVLQDALTVKKMDLANSANASKTENILKKSGNQLKEIKEITILVSNIDTQDPDHTEIQLDVFRLSEELMKSTVVMFRTALNITKKISSSDMFPESYASFFTDAKNLIARVNDLQFGHWGPNEVFFVI